MHRSETQGGNVIKTTTSLLLGGMLSLGVALLVLLLGAIAISNGVLKQDFSVQMTVIACVVGCLIGGRFAFRLIRARRLFVGIAVGAVCFLLILAFGLLSGSLEPENQWFIELAACLCGGGVSGLLGGWKKKKKSAVKRVK